jgi:hypothetical protein
VIDVRARPTGLDLVSLRPLLETPIDVRLGLAPGDRALVEPGEAVVSGSPVAERWRDAHLEEIPGPLPDAQPGGRWTGVLAPGSLGLRRRAATASGELLFEIDGRWRVATGDHAEPLESPVDGTIRDVRPGVGIVIRATGRALPGVSALGSSSRGVLTIETGPDGEVRPGSVDVTAGGRILVVGSRVDAETITRARAMGARGMIVAALSGKERRDYLASEARQRAALHRPPAFGVLVLDGATRRPIATAVMAVLAALAGREVAIIVDPPSLVFDEPGVSIPAPDPGWIRVRSGPLAGQEGRWAGLAGPRRFGPGTHLEAGFVEIPGEPPVALPLNDLERYA